MPERTLQFRVGLFVIFAGLCACAIILGLGEMRWIWEKNYRVAVNFKTAPGVRPGIPVRKNGVNIGTVQELFFEEDQGGVTVMIDIRERHVLRKDSQARLNLSLLGDASIEFTPGRDKEVLKPGARIQGEIPMDPLQIVAQIEERVTESLDSFTETSREWNRVARNLNSVLDSNRENLQTVVERSAESLAKFSATMDTVGKIFGDAASQKGLRETLRAMPELVRETQQSIKAVGRAVEMAEQNLDNLRGVTEPLSKHSASLLGKLDSSAGNLDRVLADLGKFLHLVLTEEGSLKLLATDPGLYRSLYRSTSSLEIVFKKMELVAEDVRILSDRLARHPELLGMGGALRGSNGLKTAEEAQQKPARPIQQTGGTGAAPRQR